MEVVAETERLIIRRITPDDAPAFTQLDSDPEVTRYVTGGVAEFDDERLGRWLAQYERWPGYGFFAAVEKESGEIIGWFHLRPEGDDDDQPELGYRFRKTAWGKGYATEGSRALVDRAFAVLGVSRVHATALAIHGASRRVMEKSGLRFIRLFHGDWPYQIPGDEHGDVEYAITREEWEEDRRRAERDGT
ncbi:MAG: GNAT family N-acetyltransferase [Chloroflexi bacterium]|nr:GNAT family N-acetyltransferase [Chloroflexota bacterium]